MSLSTRKPPFQSKEAPALTTTGEGSKEQLPKNTSLEQKEKMAEKARASIDTTLVSTEQDLQQSSLWSRIKGWGNKQLETLRKIPTGWKLAGLGAASVAAAFMFGFDPLRIGKAGIFVGKILFPRWTWLHRNKKLFAEANENLAPLSRMHSPGGFLSPYEEGAYEYSRAYHDLALEYMKKYGENYVSPGPLEQLLGIAKVGDFKWNTLAHW